MSITLGAATKLLDDMMINYSEWHTERAPQGKKVNSVEETSSLSDKIDAIMSMLVNGRSNVDPNNVPLASLVAQEENVDVNFIKNNNFNNNAYRNNSGNNYRPYPSANGNGYGNSYGNSYNNNRSVPSGLEAMLKEFISTQTAFNKSVEEKLDKIDTIASRVDRLASDVNLLKLKVMPNNDIDNKITTTANAIQVRINENIRLMAELRARWDREENEKLAKENNVAKVWTITTTSNANSSHVAAPPTINGKIIGVGNVSTPSAKRTKLPEIAKTAETACDKTAEIFFNLGNNDPIAVAHNDLDFDDCHISEVIKFLQKLAKSPNASAINLAFTKHITNALIKAREEKLKLETSIPRKLEDGWEPIIKMKFNDFECNALCDLGASISVMPKKIYDMLDLPPLKNCYLDVNLADNVKKKPLGRIDNVRITVNNNLVPVDFVVLDIECNASCPIVLGRPFLRTVGAVIDMREGDGQEGEEKQKGGRKRTRMHHVYDRLNQPPQRVHYNAKGQPDGKNASEFSNFIATLVKSHIPIAHDDWRQVAVSWKLEFMKTLRKFYVVDDELKDWVWGTAHKKWRDFKSDLKEKHFKEEKTEEELLACRDDRVPIEDWQWLVTRWRSEDFKKRSDQGKRNRSRQKVMHTAGNIEEAIETNPELLEKTIEQGGQKLKSTKLQMAEEETKEAWRANDVLKEHVEEIREETKSKIDGLMEEIDLLKWMMAQTIAANNKTKSIEREPEDPEDPEGSVGESYAIEDHYELDDEEERVQQEMRKAKEYFEKKQEEVQLLQKKKEAELLQKTKEAELCEKEEGSRGLADERRRFEPKQGRCTCSENEGC
ncbi:hypothetical protein QYE76_032405 [Lolium multiflorum]|uniref:Uncharacterized protein n=1 Tax=Lolium multiflorum TaxID=4521 RepID=A0AAD8VIA8_LOLMU|nr:hypothetical protein QYE76_032405 [Lolium multiflorum]